MGVEGSGGVVEGLLKYVSNYNRSSAKLGRASLGSFVIFEQDEEVQVLDEVHLKKIFSVSGSKFQQLRQIN